MADGKTNTETLHKPCDLKLPCTLVPRLLAICYEKVLCFFHSSASGRPHLELDLPEIFSTSARRTLSIFIIISWMDFQKFPVSSSIWCSLSRPRILSPRPPRILIFLLKSNVMFSSDLPRWAQNGQEGIECFLSFVWHVPYVHLKFSFSVSDLHAPFVDEILFRQRLIASLEKFWISQAVNCRLSRKVVWNACLDGDLSYPGPWHHVKKSYLQMLGSNSKFNPNKLNGKSGK